VQNDSLQPTDPLSGLKIEQSWKPTLGPVDRTTFFEEQARHRRATWRISALCALSIVITAIPFSAIVGPLSYGVAALSLRLMSIVSPVPDIVWVPFRLAWQLLNQLINSLDHLRPGDLMGVAGSVLVLLSPGIVGIIVTWLWLRMVLTTDGVGGVLLQLGAREPRMEDLEERQLMNVVEEMAIAAGLQPPAVLLIDAPVANAAVIGTGPHDARVIVTRRFLDELDRDETQGVLGHLIGSIGNGDLHIGMLVLSVFQTFGLLATILDIPLSGAARGSVFRFAKSIIRGRSDAGLIAATLLAESMGDRRLSEIDTIMEAANQPNVGGIKKKLLQARMLVLIPFMLWSLFGKMVLIVVGGLLMGQTVAWAWRTRRYLADATGVQLTRNPDGLARGLQALALRGGPIPGGHWAAHLFIVGPETTQEHMTAAQIQHLMRVRQQTSGQPLADQVRAAMDVTQRTSPTKSEHEAQPESNTIGGNALSASMHPSLRKRLSRLQAQGAHLESSEGTFSIRSGRWSPAVLAVIFIPLGILAGALVCVAIGLMTMLAFLAFEIGMGVVLMLLVPGIH
jgi:Zn-dependent protease with chaperone function